MKKNITWVISDLNKSTQFENVISALVAEGCEMSFILINMRKTAMSHFLISKNLPISDIAVISKWGYIKAIYEVIKHLQKYRPDVVHCHLLKANLLGLSGALIMRIPSRIYTRHHSTFHHEYSKKGVLLDHYFNHLATRIVSISEITYQVLIGKEQVNQHKIVKIPHGFDFTNMSYKRKIIETNKDKIVLGVVSRLIEWKGVQHVLDAFELILRKDSRCHLVIYGTEGPYKNKILAKLEQFPTGTINLIPFSEDMMTAYEQMDIYIHAPINRTVEAYGQTYVEAAAMELPVVCTMSGIAHEFVENGKNALVVDYENPHAIADAILRYIENPQLGKELGKQARKDVLNKYSLTTQTQELLRLYHN